MLSHELRTHDLLIRSEPAKPLLSCQMTILGKKPFMKLHFIFFFVYNATIRKVPYHVELMMNMRYQSRRFFFSRVFLIFQDKDTANDQEKPRRRTLRDRVKKFFGIKQNTCTSVLQKRLIHYLTEGNAITMYY